MYSVAAFTDSSSLRRYNVFTSRTLGPYALGTVGFLVLDQKPRSRDRLAAVRTATEYLRVVGHGKGNGRSV